MALFAIYLADFDSDSVKVDSGEEFELDQAAGQLDHRVIFVAGHARNAITGFCSRLCLAIALAHDAWPIADGRSPASIDSSGAQLGGDSTIIRLPANCSSICSR